MTTRTRGKGEKGIAIMMTAMLLIPLMVFAAFGVDLASWYSRISYLQKSADAAALAGTVWMPNLTTATTEACASLQRNGITGGPDCGSGPFVVDVARGSTATSLLVTVTDPSATRYFSKVLGDGDQALTRSAEAEDNLPIPLGSPLNYFGGDATRTQPPTPPTEYTVAWPTDYTTRVPTNRPCNVSASSTEEAGRWNNNSTPSWMTGQYTGSSSGNRLCQWTPATQSVGATFASNANATKLLPSNVPCNRLQTPTSNQGRWNTGSPPTYTNNRHTSGTGNRQCTWNIFTTADLPAGFNSSKPPPSGIRPCNVPGFGRWTASPGGFQANESYTSGTSNRLCQWTSEITSFTPPTPPNPIASTRSPGFWAMIEGPATIATNGDVYSTRCYTTASCGSIQNEQYREPGVNDDAGYWYVVKVPNASVGSIDINVFDASHNRNGSLTTLAGDRSFATNSTFDTQFRVFRQTNPLDFSVRTPVFPNPLGNETDGSCNWSVAGDDETAFTGVWRRLCTITAPAPGSTYLINVQTPGSSGNGVNGYALEAVTGNNHALPDQPALYAFADMGMYNNNTCSGSGCTPPPATFYLAEVGPQYAGRTLVVDLWDPGDVTEGDAAMFPKKPSTSAPRPVVDVPANTCSYTSSPEPNNIQNGSDPTGAVYPTDQSSDFTARCGVTTATNGARRFNGTWLTIRIDIPPLYTCKLSTPEEPVNPEKDPNSCWWGIEYIFSDSSQDVTTWQARIEGNPVHLTQ